MGRDEQDAPRRFLERVGLFSRSSSESLCSIGKRHKVEVAEVGGARDVGGVKRMSSPPSCRRLLVNSSSVPLPDGMRDRLLRRGPARKIAAEGGVSSIPYNGSPIPPEQSLSLLVLLSLSSSSSSGAKLYRFRIANTVGGEMGSLNLGLRRSTRNGVR